VPGQRNKTFPLAPQASAQQKRSATINHCERKQMPDNLHSRPDKLEDAETVLYEIDMLRFSKERLKENNFRSDADEWAYLEIFLVHFRNLIEFFKGDPKRADDLSISRPNDLWPNKTPSDRDLSFLLRRDLSDKYEGSKMPDKISKYLQHCTKQRVIKKKWNVEQMYRDLQPVIERFESLLPEYKPATKPIVLKPTATIGADQDGKSTASTRPRPFPDLGSTGQ
jgi:hypothetical protein